MCGIMGVVQKSDIDTCNNINDTMSIQERQDAGKGLRTMVLDATAPPQERSVAIAKAAKEVRKERKHQ